MLNVCRIEINEYNEIIKPLIDIGHEFIVAKYIKYIIELQEYVLYFQ